SLLRCLAILCACFALPQAQHNNPGQNNPFAGKPEAIQAGKAVYDQMCAGCHGSRGDGGRGPAVNKGVFKRGNEDASLFNVVKNGISGTAMPAMGLSDDEVWQVISYLRSMSGESEKVIGNVAAGEAVFAGKANCTACHMVNGSGSRFAPDLSTIGNLKAGDLRKIILKPGSREGYQPNFVEMKTKDGKWIKGLRRNEDTYSIQLFDANEELHLLRKKDLAEIKYAEKSIMPADYGKRLGETELDDLVAYLKSLKTPDLGKAAKMAVKGGLSYERILHAAKEPHNWLSYFGDYGWFIFTYKESGNVYFKEDQKFELGKSYWGGRTAAPGDVEWGGVKAIDPETAETKWDHRLYSGGYGNGLLATAGGLTFATAADGHFLALHSKTGKLLWRTQTGGDIHASPISYAVNGRQFVACSVGGILLSFALPEPEPALQSRK
ncbi:MAG: c-type cytochrome, partial [Blastocatellia bacterium]